MLDPLEVSVGFEFPKPLRKKLEDTEHFTVSGCHVSFDNGDVVLEICVTNELQDYHSPGEYNDFLDELEHDTEWTIVSVDGQPEEDFELYFTLKR